MLGKLLRPVGKGIALLFAMLVLYVLAALLFWGVSILGDEASAAPGEMIPIYVYADHFHADILIPLAADNSDWDFLIESPGFPVAREQIKMLSIGWGSRSFYLQMREWDQLTLGLSLKALSFDDTVMHVTAYHFDRLDLNDPLVRRHYISQDGYRKLLAFIRQSHQFDEAGNVLPIPDKGYYNNDTFFVANGRYQPLRTCNQWTAEALRQAGVSAPLWAPFSFALR